MKKRYLAVAIILMLVGIINTKALSVGDCEVLASFKLNSSLDEEQYICKGKKFGNSIDNIYYSGEGSTIEINNLDAYYFTNWDELDVTLNITGINNIAMLHKGNSKFKVTGSGSLKFKQNSFVKKVINGEAINHYIYDDKFILDENKKIYEGTALEFEENYEYLKKLNNLPDEYDSKKIVLVQALDFVKMTSVTVSPEWINKNIQTDLNKSYVDGFGLIEFVKEKKEEPKKTEPAKKEQKEDNKNKIENKSQLKTDNVVLISDKKLKDKYKLKEKNLKKDKVANKVSDTLKNENKDLISLYDVSVYNGKKEVPMKNGKYMIKIKLDNDVDKYENYQIIYVNDNNEIEEYIDGTIEGEYIVFYTSHLSQYGVVASEVENKALNVNVVNPVKKPNVNVSNAFKISILLSIVVATSGLIIFILVKSDLLSNKKSSGKRA